MATLLTFHYISFSFDNIIHNDLDVLGRFSKLVKVNNNNMNDTDENWDIVKIVLIVKNVYFSCHQYFF